MATPYATQLNAHLSEYKRERLGITADGVWHNDGQPRPHILPADLYQLNVLESIRGDFWTYFAEHSKTLARHTDFHHLNSSQAFAFNLFFPWLKDAIATPSLMSALGMPGDVVREWRFEHMPDQAERTAVDVHLQLASGAQVLVEVKLTEDKFGSGKVDDSRRTKRTETYLPRLAGKLAGDVNEEIFFLNYQLFRNVSHLDIARGDRLLLVLPRANEFTWGFAEGFLKLLSNECRQAVHMVAVEDLVDRLDEATVRVPQLAEHMRQFREKYLPTTQPR